MYTTEEKNQHFRQAKKNLISSLIVNLIVPWILYILLHNIFNNDTTLLAISTSIPVIRTIAIGVWSHKIDWIGIIGVLGFAIALVVSTIFGGSSLPLKLIHPVVFGIIGLSFLISVSLGKPLLIIIFKVLMRGNQERFNSLVGRKKLTIMSTLFGGISLLGAVIHIILALTVSTSTFIIMSRVVSWVTIFALLVSAKLIVQRIK